MKRTLLIALVVFGWVGGAALASTTAANPATAGAEETTDSATAQDDLPPGVTEAGVTDPLALVDAHRQALQNTSYTLSTAFTCRQRDGTVFDRGTYTAAVAPGAESYYATASSTSENDTESFGADYHDVAVWANETDAAVARDRAGDAPTYEHASRDDAPLSPGTQWELLYSAFDTTDTAVVGQIERNGTTLYKIASTSSPDASSPYAGNLYDFTALVDSEGVVHSFHLTHETTIDDQRVIVSRTTQLVQIGNTTVERPSWYQRTVENETED